MRQKVVNGKTKHKPNRKEMRTNSEMMIQKHPKPSPEQAQIKGLKKLNNMHIQTESRQQDFFFSRKEVLLP